MRYHPRFDSNAWVWPTGPIEKEINKGNVISLGLVDGLPDIIFGERYTSETSNPWFVVYADDRGGVSAATFVIDDAENGTYAFYNTRLLDSWDMPSEKNSGLWHLMNPIKGVPFSPREATMSTLWNTLTTGVSPSYESFDDLNALINSATLTYFASHFIPQSINKLHIGG